MTNALTPEDHIRISEAIRAAEARTAGEIYCVVARTSGHYFAGAAVALLLAIFLVSALVAFALHFLWIDPRLTTFAVAQILAVLCALLVVWLSPTMAMLFVPVSLRYRRAHDNAMKQFLAHNVHRTSARTGVLIFVSLQERYATIIADSGINSHVPQATWNAIMAGLTESARGGVLADGFVVGIGRVGDLLAQHIPQRTADTNELNDHLVEI